MDRGTSRACVELDSDERFVPLRRQLGVTTFGLNEIILRAGERGRIHRHRSQEEVYLVLEGRLTLVVEREAETLERGELIRVAPEIRRQLVNRGPDTLVLLALGGTQEHAGRDGEAFAAWEDEQGAPPGDIPLPEDLPPDQRER